MESTKAFVGVSLDSKAFTRLWVRDALVHLCAHYDQVIVVLADELFAYTRATELQGDRTIVHFPSSREAANRLSEERMRFFQRERKRLPAQDAMRVQILQWKDYSDATYASLWRQLWTAYFVLDRFRDVVHKAASRHTLRAIQGEQTPAHAEVSAAYLLDEMAMCLRITEVEGYSAEYHPGADLSVLRDLYAGAFADLGLTVESLVGHAPRRTFTVIGHPAYESQAASVAAGN